MRSENEMFGLITSTAEQDERIRAVILNGSRANPNAPKDPFQDFDVVYYVEDTAPFWHNLEWIKRFGELMILQLPDEMGDSPASHEEGFAYLMQFTDGNRIDLGIFPIAKLEDRLQDSLSRVLLDKDGLTKSIEPASEQGYLPRAPTAKAFSDCCNEFWWVCPYVAKGLWRGEIVYAKYMEQIVREELMKMLVWHIGWKTHFAHNPGKFGKYFQQYLETELWKMLQKTYADAGYEKTWEALFAMGKLFRTAAIPLAKQFGFEYPSGNDQKVTAFLEQVRRLPKNAKTI